MKNITIILIALLYLNNPLFSQRIISEDRTIYLLKLDSNTIRELFGVNIKPFKIIPNDIKLAERQLNKAFLNAKANRNISKGRNLDSYIRQYFGYTDHKGFKIVWINCMAIRKDLPEENYLHPYLMKDGGDRYFQVKVNLSTKKSFDFIVNGYE